LFSTKTSHVKKKLDLRTVAQGSDLNKLRIYRKKRNEFFSKQKGTVTIYPKVNNYVVARTPPSDVPNRRQKNQFSQNLKIVILKSLSSLLMRMAAM